MTRTSREDPTALETLSGAVKAGAHYLADLLEISAGRRNVPQVTAPLDMRPTVTNYRLDLTQARAVPR